MFKIKSKLLLASKGWSQNWVKIAALTPSPSIFTETFSPMASNDRRDQEMSHFNEWEDHLYPMH